MRPTLFNKLTPRMYRQPIHLSMMIRARRLARARRLDEQRKLVEWRLDVLREAQFEKRLMSPEEGIWQTDEWRTSPFASPCFSSPFHPVL